MIRANSERLSRRLPTLRAGKFIVVADDEDRENEGDLICAAEQITPDDGQLHAPRGARTDLRRRSPGSGPTSWICRRRSTKHRRPADGIHGHRRCDAALRRDDGRERRRPGDDHRGGRRSRHDRARSAPSGPYLTAAGARWRRAAARGAYGGGGRSGAAGRALAGGRDLRDHERGREHGETAGARALRGARTGSRSSRSRSWLPIACRPSAWSTGWPRPGCRRRSGSGASSATGTTSMPTSTSRWSMAMSPAARACSFGCTRKCLTGDVFHSQALRLRVAARPGDGADRSRRGAGSWSIWIRKAAASGC